MSKMLTQEEFDLLEEGTVVVVRYVGSPLDVVCFVAVDEFGRHGVNPVIFYRTDWRPFTNWLKEVGSEKWHTHVSLKEDGHARL